MSSQIEAATRTLLSEPPWLKVFKNTYDAIEELLNKVGLLHVLHFSLHYQVLVAIAAVGMAVKLASAITSGFLFCLVADIQCSGPDCPVSFTNIGGPYASTLAAYAAQDGDCHDQVQEEFK